MTDLTIGERISILIEENGISNYQLAKAIDKSDSTISRIINKGAKPNSETLDLICDYFKVTQKWVLTGIGSKHKASKNASIIALNNLFPSGEDFINHDGKNQFVRINEGNYLMLNPFVEKENQQQFIDNCFDHDYLNSLPINSTMVSKPLDDYYISFEANGDDMYSEDKPSIADGYIATGMEIRQDKWRSRFIYKRNKLYIIVHKEGIIIREVLQYNPKNETLLIHAYNPDYQDEIIQLSNCLKILMVTSVSWKF